jgi:hypothetical protein
LRCLGRGLEGAVVTALSLCVFGDLKRLPKPRLPPHDAGGMCLAPLATHFGYESPAHGS